MSRYEFSVVYLIEDHSLTYLNCQGFHNAIQHSKLTRYLSPSPTISHPHPRQSFLRHPSYSLPYHPSCLKFFTAYIRAMLSILPNTLPFLHDKNNNLPPSPLPRLLFTLSTPSLSLHDETTVRMAQSSRANLRTCKDVFCRRVVSSFYTLARTVTNFLTLRLVPH
jgi:hypothetical protein